MFTKYTNLKGKTDGNFSHYLIFPRLYKSVAELAQPQPQIYNCSNFGSLCNLNNENTDTDKRRESNYLFILLI